eukprot:CAMPEP_0172555826 /NCGR_PEP_ID=MMETSP1067-20121228/60516_1 /TAXON_ID=265564 ORGANISM="Thalassiosira punctigera, Strain Tpunct2005C2" /NCGR_SAMPLE_ID=MMETSP1067 /ASSEMBLY_ACC=CAM_ASM_000444 /LENGTH=153 /DNA_ID=CAMNT_0013344431 /DNA_START=133 /DNA_END=591 /DNA_ORIENTATION=+
MTLSTIDNFLTSSAAAFGTPHPCELVECDACPYCGDTCEDESSCTSCQKKVNAMHTPCCRGPQANWLVGALSSFCPRPAFREGERPRTYTMCQLRRHNHANSAWILVGDEIFDATPYIRSHPGGMTTILRKSGGAADCTEDLRFHSKRAQKEW